MERCGAAAAQLFPRLHVAWELLIEDDYVRVASVVDELAKSSSVERRGAALLVAAQAMESGVAPSLVLTDAVAPSLLSAAARGDAALGRVGWAMGRPRFFCLRMASALFCTLCLAGPGFIFFICRR